LHKLFKHNHLLFHRCISHPLHSDVDHMWNAHVHYGGCIGTIYLRRSHTSMEDCITAISRLVTLIRSYSAN